jgi:hypothetical protein
MRLASIARFLDSINGYVLAEAQFFDEGRELGGEEVKGELVCCCHCASWDGLGGFAALGLLIFHLELS